METLLKAISKFLSLLNTNKIKRELQKNSSEMRHLPKYVAGASFVLLYAILGYLNRPTQLQLPDACSFFIVSGTKVPCIQAPL